MPSTTLEFPRITDVLARLQQPAAPATAAPVTEGPLPPAMARMVVEGAVMPPMPSSDLLPQLPVDCPLPPVPAPPAPAPPALSLDIEPVEELRPSRWVFSVYEMVFLMLAFSVMVLLTAPPLVDVLLAAHGVKG